MVDKLVGREVALLAREKGFDEVCYYFHSNEFEEIENSKFHRNSKMNIKHDKENYVTAPTQSLLQTWLRKQPTPIIVTPTTDFVAWEVEINHPDIGNKKIIKNNDDKWFDSYEEALEYGLKYGLNLIQ